MSAPRSTVLYSEGVRLFLEFASERAGMNHRFLCPCTTCANRYWLSESSVREHLICKGFMSGYTTWVFHGEDYADNETEDVPDEDYADSGEMNDMLLEGFGMYDTASVGLTEDEEEEEPEDEDELYCDAEAYRQLVLDGSKDLYPGCQKYSKLHFLIKFMNIKNVWGVPNGSFDETLSLFRDALPEGQDLPKNYHACKKYIKDVGLGYETIDACKYDCLMFRGIHSEATECPVCHTSRWRSEKKGVDGKRVHKIAHKVIRHFKLKHRVRRMFLSSKTAEYMTWHSHGRTKDGLMRHPADSPAWKHFDGQHKWFSKDPRNIRFALATDGFNPFKNMNLAYNIWPIVLIPYNLPPWICMKQSNFLLNVIVPGRKSPGKELDIYMQLTIDDLKEFWKPGVMAYDSVIGKKFRVHAALLWTISDWLGRGCLSGESLTACSHCLTNTCSRWLHNGKKTCFLGHRRFLTEDHEYRYDETSFNGRIELREPLVQPSGSVISGITESFHTEYGKLQKQKSEKKRKKRNEEDVPEDIYEHSAEKTFKKRSVFFQLEYWETLLVRNNLDIMHIEKNVFDNIVHTILDVDKRSKDNLNSRLDLKAMNIRAGLHVNLTGPKAVIPRAIYQMQKHEKQNFLKVLKYARFPDGYASNLFHKVNLSDSRITGLKTHDCHIIMLDLFPMALCRSLPSTVSAPLIRLSKYFKALNSKVIDVRELMKWEDEVPIILCELEKLFPPSFFDIMVHLIIHLVTEVRTAGPIHYRSMWAMERYIGKLKNMVHNYSYPEGSIAEGYIFDESLSYCSRYLHHSKTKFNRAPRHDDKSDNNPATSNQQYLRRIGRPLSGSATTQLNFKSWTQAHRCVLMNCPEIEEFAQ